MIFTISSSTELTPSDENHFCLLFPSDLVASCAVSRTNACVEVSGCWNIDALVHGLRVPPRMIFTISSSTELTSSDENHFCLLFPADLVAACAVLRSNSCVLEFQAVGILMLLYML